MPIDDIKSDIFMDEAAQCCHVLDANGTARRLYLSLAFTQMWKLQIRLTNFTRLICVCTKCGKVVAGQDQLNAHMEEMKHTLYIAMRPFSVICSLCKKQFTCPPVIVRTCLIALPTFPAQALPTGFRNLGNSCYSSSVLAALSHCQPLVTAASLSFLPICRVFAASSTLNHSFNAIIHEIMPKFSPFVQEDAAEFLLYMLDAFTQDPTMQKLITIKTTTHQYCPACKNHLENAQDYTLFPVTLSKDGWNGFRLKAPHKVRRYGKPLNWPEVQDFTFSAAFSSFFHHGTTSVYSLQTCIETMFAASDCECEKCKNKEAKMYMTITELPEVMILHIARFGNRWFGLGKIYYQLSFPELDADFSGLVSNDINIGTCTYSLYATTNHSGTMNTGHYVSYARKGSKWFLFDDQNVSEVTREEVLTSQAFLLYYCKNVPEEVVNLRHDLIRNHTAIDVSLPIHAFSDPKMWENNIPFPLYPDEDDTFVRKTHEIVQKDLIREPTEIDLRSRLISKYPYTKGFFSISDESAIELFSFLCEKGPVPKLYAKEDGVQVSDILSYMVSNDPPPKLKPVAEQEPCEVNGEITQEIREPEGNQEESNKPEDSKVDPPSSSEKKPEDSIVDPPSPEEEDQNK